MSVQLSRLIGRAAAIVQPFNTQDSILIIKALNTLRERNPNTKKVCEKAAFSLASAPQEVPVGVVVDTLNALSSLQVSSQPIVHNILAKRLLELKKSAANNTLPTQTIQKASVALMKMGKRYAPVQVCDEVLQLLHLTLREHPQDMGLRLAYVGLFPYTSYMSKYFPLSDEDTAFLRPSVTTLLESAEAIAGGPSSPSASSSKWRGNAALQAAHIYVPLSTLFRNAEKEVSGGEAPSGKYRARWQHVSDSFVKIDFNSIGTGGCAQFILDFADHRRVLVAVLPLLSHPGWYTRASTNEITKVAAALGHVVANGSLHSALAGEPSSSKKKDLEAKFLRAVTLCVTTVSKKVSDKRGDDLLVDQRALVTLYQCIRRCVTGIQMNPSAMEVLSAALCNLHRATACCFTVDGCSQGGSTADMAASVLYDLCRLLLAAGTVLDSTELREAMVSVGAVVASAKPNELSARSRVQTLHGLCLLSKAQDVNANAAAMRPVIDALTSVFTSDEALLVEVNVEDLRMLSDTIKVLVDGDGSAASCASLVVAIEKGIRVAPPSGAHLSLLIQDHVLEKAFAESALDGRQRFWNLVESTVRTTASEWIHPRVMLQLLDRVDHLKKEDSDMAASLRDSLSSLLLSQSVKWSENVASTAGAGVDALDSTFRSLIGCAEKAKEMGLPLHFVSQGHLGKEAKSPQQRKRKDGFFIDVDALLAQPSFSRTDAAQLLRLMSGELNQAGFHDLSEASVRALVDYALNAEGVDTPHLLYLLQANKDAKSSTVLFSPVHLDRLINLSEQRLVYLSSPDNALSQQRREGDLERIVKCLLESQVMTVSAPRHGTASEASRERLHDSLRVAAQLLNTSTPLGKVLAFKTNLLCGE